MKQTTGHNADWSADEGSVSQPVSAGREGAGQKIASLVAIQLKHWPARAAQAVRGVNNEQEANNENNEHLVLRGFLSLAAWVWV